MRLNACGWSTSLCLLLLVGACGTGGAPAPMRRNGNSSAAGNPETQQNDGASGVGDVGNPITDNPGGKLLPTSGAISASAGSGGAGGNMGQAGIGQNGSTNPDGNCGSSEIKTNVKRIDKPGNIMVVFDRSGSMEAEWNGMPKYKAAGNALIEAITPLKSLLTMGGIFFPSSIPEPTCACDLFAPPECCVNPGQQACDVSTIDKPDQINFTPAEMFMTGLQTQWNVPRANGTPLQNGIARAAEAITATMFKDPLIVIVMTDGEPNCNTDQMKVLDQITAWKTAGITTHVIGLPGAQGAADLLNMMATAGGSDKYIDPKDPMELQTRLQTVIGSTVKMGFDTCIFAISPKAEVPEKLHLLVTQAGVENDVPRNLSKDAHWKINAEGTQVDLEGQLCDFAKDGTFETLRFVFGCVDVPPLDPPPPPVLH